MSEPFDWEILHRPSAMAMVRGQLGFSWMVLSGRLAQLTDDQYFWRPSSEALTVVRRHHAGRFRPVGSGEWGAPGGGDRGGGSRRAGRSRTTADHGRSPG